jgi:hypothetical protein
MISPLAYGAREPLKTTNESIQTAINPDVPRRVGILEDTIEAFVRLNS